MGASRMIMSMITMVVVATHTAQQIFSEADVLDAYGWNHPPTPCGVEWCAGYEQFTDDAEGECTQCTQQKERLP